jgi:hypothetical protein
MNADENSKQKQMEIAQRLAALHPGLEINQVGTYTSLRAGSGRLTNCVVVSRTADKASFLITSPELLRAIERAGLPFTTVRSKARAFQGSQYRVSGVSAIAIDQHQDLFRKLVAASEKFVTELRKGSVHG